MSVQPGKSVVRVLTADDRTAGVAVLVGPGQVITCAHVINTALGRDRRTQERPGDDVVVTLEFPLLPAEHGRPPRRSATVGPWLPPPRERLAGDDFAGLSLIGELPAGAEPAALASTAPAAGRI